MTDQASPKPTRDHIRRPNLPWRVSRITECGRPVSDVASIIDRAEALARIKRDGVQRAVYSLCMTCMNTCRNHPDWDDDPIKALGREYFGATDPRLRYELLALGELVAAHRGEFEDLIRGLADTTSLSAARRKRAAGGR
jgi:hypothetical protein